ncbi:TlyA family RNA methyltransferase [Sneathiella sp.]|jgi:23S rRNA (cytidine1920-2'-O)/16S rRNA (cytidine1409-2'-O)-methyltransferase|uniref:TlyA family RNA methyltransferase n=1 Tax=Sneathiella sp. TaxID=1964365 RepID=UPI0039E4A3CD
MREAGKRLDLELVARGLCESRAKAQAMIADGRVTVEGLPARKPNQKVWDYTPIDIAAVEIEWVGRGAHKIIAAIDHFSPVIKDRIAADIGASTGGFTQVLIHKGAAKVFAVDVGHDQLHPSLVDHPQIINMEGMNARHLTTDDIADPLDLVVTDASFISLKKLLPASLGLCAPGAMLLALVKPQFEVGKGNLGKGGVIRDIEQAEAVKEDMERWINQMPGWRCLGSIDSPITGSDGNHEYLMGAQFDG